MLGVFKLINMFLIAKSVLILYVCVCDIYMRMYMYMCSHVRVLMIGWMLRQASCQHIYSSIVL